MAHKLVFIAILSTHLTKRAQQKVWKKIFVIGKMVSLTLKHTTGYIKYC